MFRASHVLHVNSKLRIQDMFLSLRAVESSRRLYSSATNPMDIYVLYFSPCFGLVNSVANRSQASRRHNLHKGKPCQCRN